MTSPDRNTQPQRPRSISANILLLAASLIFVFAAAEALSRLYLVHFASAKTFFRYASARQLDTSDYVRFGLRYAPHQYLGYYPTPDFRQEVDGKLYNRHNARGFRGEEIPMPKPAGEFRIACLGGSTTYTNQVFDYRLSYPDQLQAVLRERGRPGVRVINAGAEGYTSWESLINLQFRVLELEPDLIIIYHGINDALARLVYPYSAYRADNSGFRAAPTSLTAMPTIWEYSTILRIAMIKLGLAEPHNRIAMVKQFAKTAWHGELQRQWSKGIYPSGIFEKASVADMLDHNPPRYFRDNLLDMIGDAQARGIKVVLATFAYSPEFKQVAMFATPGGQRALAESNQVVKSLAGTPGVHVFDFAEAFPKDPELFVDGQHVNEKGARIKAELFAEYLVKNGLVPGESAARQ